MQVPLLRCSSTSIVRTPRYSKSSSTMSDRTTNPPKELVAVSIGLARPSCAFASAWCESSLACIGLRSSPRSCCNAPHSATDNAAEEPSPDALGMEPRIRMCIGCSPIGGNCFRRKSMCGCFLGLKVRPSIRHLSNVSSTSSSMVIRWLMLQAKAGCP